jgi:3-oxoacyl-[acyl-carrier protein] reductase
VSDARSFAGKVALVTGGSRGIGRATAAALAAAGATVVIVYVRRAADAEDAVHAIEAAGGAARAIRADVSSEIDMSRLADAVGAAHRRLDVLINNAGVTCPERTDTLSLAAWREMVDVNLTGAFLATRACLPLLRAAGSAAIVNVASVAGVRGGTLGPHYAAVKGGLIAMTRYWARELLPDRIRVNCVAPSMTDTEMARTVWPGSARERMEQLTGLGRYAEPREVADAIVFLASDAASYIVGECLNITGGF